MTLFAPVTPTTRPAMLLAGCLILQKTNQRVPA